jgi:hypothetical protein
MYFDGSIFEKDINIFSLNDYMIAMETIQTLFCQFAKSIIRNGKGKETLLNFANVLTGGFF